jgi:hypothetical protein
MNGEAKASKPLIKRLQGRLTRENRANEHGDKIDEVVVSHPRARANRTCSAIAFQMPVYVSA